MKCTSRKQNAKQMKIQDAGREGNANEDISNVWKKAMLPIVHCIGRHEVPKKVKRSSNQSKRCEQAEVGECRAYQRQVESGSASGSIIGYGL